VFRRDSRITKQIPSVLRLHAREVGGFVDAARAFISSYLRIGAQRARSNDLVFDYAAGGDRLRRGCGFDPFHRGRSRVERAGSDAPAAVEHAGNHEESEEIAGTAAQSLGHFFVILDAHHRIQLWIRPAKIHDQFAAATLEGRQVGVGALRIVPKAAVRDASLSISKRPSGKSASFSGNAMNRRNVSP